jgi:thymidylate synthase (FAD)
MMMSKKDQELPDRLFDTEDMHGYTTFRALSPGAEKWIGRPIQCLDHGFVYLVDYMGNDESVVQAARTSYGQGTKKVSNTEVLIRHLRRHFHNTPFEMVEFKFHCKMPIFVARQWIRHRTASVNEYSGRYSEMEDEFYVPEPGVLKKQSQSNRQGRDEDLEQGQKSDILQELRDCYRNQYDFYQRLLNNHELARELARLPLSVGNYTQWYWKIDLHNLMHFLHLRLDEHAQYEIRVFAQAMARIVREAVPICFQAFEDYQLNSLTLTGLELGFLRLHVDLFPAKKERAHQIILDHFGNKREAGEFIEKLVSLGMILD